MDKGLKREKISQVLKTKYPPVRPADQADAERLAYERRSWEQLQLHVGHHEPNKHILPQKENADSVQQRDIEDEDTCNDEDNEDHQLYDSLDAAANSCSTSNSAHLLTERLDTQMENQLLTDDAYCDLRYDPNWRTNLRGAARFNESPQNSIEDYYHVPKPSHGYRERLKAGYRYITDTSPVAVVTPHIIGKDSDQPFCLQPEDGKTSLVTSPHCLNQSPEADHSKPSYNITKNESDTDPLKGFRKKRKNSSNSAGTNDSRTPEQTEDIHAMYVQEFKTCYLQEQRNTQGGPTELQQISTSNSPKTLFSKKLERLKEDIVERNKRTLGCNTSKCGSYLSVYSRKPERHRNNNKVCATLKETDSQEDSSDSVDTKELRVSKGTKAWRNENHEPPGKQQQHPPAGEVKAEQGDLLARAAAVTQPNPQKTTSSQPLLPNIHLNIDLTTSSHLLPLIQQRGQDDIINLASLYDCLHWNPLSEHASSPSCQQTKPGMSSQMSQERRNTHLHYQKPESSPQQWHRTTALKWPLSCNEEDQKWSNEVHRRQFPQSLPRTPSTTLSLSSGTFTVLPAIGKSMAGKELSVGENTDYPVYRSSSDSYLIQMEKEKQLRRRVPYKEYTLKDYKQLKPDMNVQCLGPDSTAIEKAKMKRQKLYSNVIREQNKKISRIPFRLAKDHQDDGKKVPRTKALEYAKTITKPPVQSQPKHTQRNQSESFKEHWDMSNTATLELLRKRHEEEKQAVANFRKVNAF